MSDGKNILPGGRDRLTEEKLLAYLEGRLNQAEQREVEEWLSDEGMESDAMEGLQSLQPHETRQSVSRINHRLRTSLFSRKRRRKPLKTEQLTWVAVVIILILVVVAYIVVRKSMK